ncbi:hypothetical protein BDY17DRAFT_184365 [Neohortaea acidophila]|uniref:SnoaL-like domain-containing protein n=1 Tax=Neohortaea acidophila TaxID=245834 RepID=A0A6A6PPK3_9PEZI|nr:uncharacterized protein BDY17DRAFT_184365 [Neohortaea acidophila]KAF2481187.1 hypothetical protein BDY17DRAFT_184365 [Neohortaea acidophila]
MASNLYERITQTALEFAHGYDQANCGRDITTLSTALTPTCRRYFAPASLLTQAPALAAGRSNAEFEAQTQQELTGAMSSWEVEILDLTVDERARKAVVRLVSHATSKRGKTYDFENVFTLFFTEDGAKVEKIVQFVDVGAAGQFMRDEMEFTGQLQ